jgi:cell wall-associated NlpC family hydrolase
MDAALVPTRLKIAALLAAACAVAMAAVIVAGGGGGSDRSAATAASSPVAEVPAAIAKRVPEAKAKPLKSHPKVVVAVPPGQAPPTEASNVPGNSQPPSDAEIRSELTAFREHLTGYGVARGPVSETRSDGTAVAPLEAPDIVATVIAAGNEIATKPYKWGGGHGAWKDSGYDCSGSVSFALAGAGLLDGPLTSGGLMSYGKPGPGRWITIYANNGHVFMVVAGLRFDTSGARGGTRWQPPDGRSYGGFTARHPPGL